MTPTSLQLSNFYKPAYLLMVTDKLIKKIVGYRDTLPLFNRCSQIEADCWISQQSIFEIL